MGLHGFLLPAALLPREIRSVNAVGALAFGSECTRILAQPTCIHLLQAITTCWKTNRHQQSPCLSAAVVTSCGWCLRPRDGCFSSATPWKALALQHGFLRVRCARAIPRPHLQHAFCHLHRKVRHCLCACVCRIRAGLSRRSSSERVASHTANLGTRERSTQVTQCININLPAGALLAFRMGLLG